MNDDPPVLDYKASTPPRATARSVLVIGVAAAIGFGAWFVLAAAALGTDPVAARGRVVPVPASARPVLNALLTLISIIGLFLLLRDNDRRWTWQAGLGLLLGIGAAVLVHKLGFASSI